MKLKLSIVSLLCMSILIGCSAAPKKISYVSLEKPSDQIDAVVSKPKPVSFSKIRFGIFYLSPIGVNSYLKQAAQESGTPVLRNVDVQLRAQFCILPLFPVLCFGREKVVVMEGNEAEVP